MPELDANQKFNNLIKIRDSQNLHRLAAAAEENSRQQSEFIRQQQHMMEESQRLQREQAEYERREAYESRFIDSASSEIDRFESEQYLKIFGGVLGYADHHFRQVSRKDFLDRSRIIIDLVKDLQVKIQDVKSLYETLQGFTIYSLRPSLQHKLDSIYEASTRALAVINFCINVGGYILYIDNLNIEDIKLYIDELELFLANNEDIDTNRIQEHAEILKILCINFSNCKSSTKCFKEYPISESVDEEICSLQKLFHKLTEYWKFEKDDREGATTLNRISGLINAHVEFNRTENELSECFSISKNYFDSLSLIQYNYTIRNILPQVDEAISRIRKTLNEQKKYADIANSCTNTVRGKQIAGGYRSMFFDCEKLENKRKHIEASRRRFFLHSLITAVLLYFFVIEPIEKYIEDKAQAQARAEAQAQENARASREAQARLKADAVAASNARAEAQARAEAKAIAEAQAKIDAQAKAEAQLENKIQRLSKDRAAALAQAEPLGRALAQAQASSTPSSARVNSLSQAYAQAQATVAEITQEYIRTQTELHAMRQAVTSNSIEHQTEIRPTDSTSNITTPETRGDMEISKPSFDCNKATTLVEKLICSNANLGKLDSLLSEQYKRVISQNGIKESQRAWLKVLNTCNTTGCIENSYISRINELKKM